MIMRLVLIVPVFDELDKMEKNVKKLHEYAENNLDIPYLIVISAYRSSKEIDALGQSLASALKNVEYFSTAKRGKGVGIIEASRGFSQADDWVGFIDVDLPVNVEKLSEVERLVKENKHDLIVGCRYGKGTITGSLARRMLSKAYLLLANFILFGSRKVEDFQTGFKFWRSTLFEDVSKYSKFDTGLFFDTSLVYYSQKLGKKIFYLPVDYTLDEEKSTVNPIKVSMDFFTKLVKLKADRS